jgi:hypothetical protein
MPAKSTNAKTAVVSAAAPAQENKKTAKKTEQVATPVQPVADVSAQPVVSTKKGGAKKATATAQPVTAVSTQPVVAAPVSTSTQKKGGARKATQVAAATPVAAAPQSKKGGAKKVAQPVQEVAPVEAQVEAQVEAPVEAQVEEGQTEEGGRHNRSFKVRLPNCETFEGRFTGLTPYQAANKALSKYFRDSETKDQEEEITFAICESTRKSKKTVYSYVGRRQKLATPVTYTIQGADGKAKVITKNFKNTLKKVKKTEKVEAPAESA